MTTLALVQTLDAIGVHIQAEAGKLRVAGPTGVITPAMLKDLANRKSEIIAILEAGRGRYCEYSLPSNIKVEATESWPLIEDGRRVRWRKADERGCRPCKRCRGPIIWAQVVEDTDPKAKRKAWIRLDPDLMPHGCGSPRSGRFACVDTP